MADAVQYLVSRICTAWRDNKVVSVLFLDVKGAFPNAVTTWLLHNLKCRRILSAIVWFIKQLLHERKTRLKFNDYTLETTNITNGIGQGDPLSMLLYILYNADLLEIPNNSSKEDTIGYINDIALMAIGSNFEDTTDCLLKLMMKDKGGI